MPHSTFDPKLEVGGAGSESAKTIFEGVLHRVEAKMLGTSGVGAIQEWAVLAGCEVWHRRRRIYRPKEWRGVNCENRTVLSDKLQAAAMAPAGRSGILLV